MRKLKAISQQFPLSDHPVEFTLCAVYRGRDRPQLAANLGSRAGCFRGGLIFAYSFENVLAFTSKRRLVKTELACFRLELRQFGRRLFNFFTEPGRVCLEVRNHAGVEELTLVAFKRAATLDEHRSQSPRPFAKLLDVAQAIANVARSACRKLRLNRHHCRIEYRKGRLQFRFVGGTLKLGRGQSFELDSQTRYFATRNKSLQSRQLNNERSMTLGGFSLTFEWAKLAADFSQQVLHAQQICLGCVEATLSLFFALPELQHPGSFFNDRPPVLRAGVEYCVNLALANNDVLLPTDAGIAE